MKSWIRQNWLAILSILVAGLISKHFYDKANIKTEPILIQDDVRTRIIDSGNLSIAPLKVVRALDGMEIRQDVTATRFYFWNDGKKAIKREGILDSIIVGFKDDTVEILDYRITDTTRALVRPYIKRDVGDPNRKLKIEFAILEEHDGFACQIIYMGNPEATLFVSGNIEDRTTIGPNKAWERKENLKEYWKMALITSILLLIGLPLMILVKEGKKGLIRFVKSPQLKIMAFTSLILITIMLIIMYIFTVIFPWKGEPKRDIRGSVPKELIKS